MTIKTFTAANGTALTALDANWKVPTGGTGLVVFGNRANSPSDGSFCCNYYDQVTDAKHFSIASFSAEPYSLHGCAIRIQSGANSFFYAIREVATGVVYAGECIAGSGTDWDSGQSGWGTTDPVELYVDATTSTTIHLKRNGATIATYTGKNALSGGKSGVVAFNGSGGDGISQWEGGDVAASGTTITPNAGALTLSGIAPSLTTQLYRAAAVGALVLTGIAPQVTNSGMMARTPAVASLAFTGIAPVVTNSGSKVISPSSGSLTLVGTTVTQDLGVPAPIAGALVIVGSQATVAQGIVRTPSVGALALSGVAPTVTQTVAGTRTPTVGALALTGVAPGVTQQFARRPSAGSLSLTGIAPSVAVSSVNITITTSAGALAFIGNAPTVIRSSPVIIPLVGSLSFTGYASTAVSFVFVRAGFVGGTAVDEDGVMGTDFLADGVAVPAGSLMLNGFAHTSAGLRYVSPWPAAGQVFYQNGIARRPDGAMCVIASGTVNSFIGGWAVTDRGEVIATSQPPELVHNGIGQLQSGAVCMSEVA